MFTGIVQGNFPVTDVQDKPGLKTFIVELSSELIEGLEIGASVAIDGVCHTVVKIDGQNVTFDAMTETLQKTTIGELKTGDTVNIERSAKMGDEIGGHVMSGHVETMGHVSDVHDFENNRVLTIKVPQNFVKFIFEKGFIGISGCSLTVTDYDRENGFFKVYLIPETLRVTGFDKIQKGDTVNIEIDSRTRIIVDTIINYFKDSKLNALWEKTLESF